MRRVLLICSTLVLLIAMAVPSFAMADGSTILHTDLMFDYVELLYGSGSAYARFPWPFRNVASSDSNETFRFTGTTIDVDGSYSVNKSGGVYSLVGDFDLPCDRFSLVAEDLFIQPAQIIGENLTLYAHRDGYDFTMMNPLFYGYVALVTESVDGYAVALEEFYFYAPYSSAELPIGELLLNGLREMEFWNDNNPYIYITELRVEATLSGGYIEGGGQVTPQLHVYADNLTSASDYQNTYGWIGAQDFMEKEVIYEEVYIDDGFEIGTFLRDSVNSFLKVELFPGFSIDKLFYIIMVVFVLLWFIKLIS